MPEKHSRIVAGNRIVWYTERLWELARDLPVKVIAIDALPELDRDCWFGTAHVPTIRTVAEHARRIRDADLSYPIILSANGGLMDGGHRLAKAWLDGATEIRAAQFTVDPEPDQVIPLASGTAGY